MSAGRRWIKELYVGFLLLALSFLYLSHLTHDLAAEAEELRPAQVIVHEVSSADDLLPT